MEDFEQIESDLLEQSHHVATLCDYFARAERCNEFIEKLEDLSRAKRPRLATGNVQSLVARIARLEGENNRLQSRFIHVGGDYASTSSGGDGDNIAKRLVWHEIDTSFESRILTGAVINTNYIEPRQFLEDARDIVLDHVRDTIEKYDSVKVNTMFNGEFVAGDKRANKSVGTKNCELFRTSDLQEWFNMRVIEPTLASLEEFQERDSGWALSRILNLAVNVNRYNPLHAGCYI